MKSGAVSAVDQKFVGPLTDDTLFQRRQRREIIKRKILARVEAAYFEKLSVVWNSVGTETDELTQSVQAIELRMLRVPGSPVARNEAGARILGNDRYA
jgi:hypothetical protein